MQSHARGHTCYLQMRSNVTHLACYTLVCPPGRPQAAEPAHRCLAAPVESRDIESSAGKPDADRASSLVGGKRHDKKKSY